MCAGADNRGVQAPGEDFRETTTALAGNKISIRHSSNSRCSGPATLGAQGASFSNHAPRQTVNLRDAMAYSGEKLIRYCCR
jgi:hypothetical protein